MSNTEKVAAFPGAVAIHGEVTLEQVVQQVADWRAHKKSVSEPIPESIWQQLFLLEKNKIPAYTLRGATGIGTKQWYRRFPKRSGTEKPFNPPRSQTANLRQPLPAGLMREVEKVPAANTLTVEFCRADGRVMKIHSTMANVAEWMAAFFSGA